MTPLDWLFVGTGVALFGAWWWGTWLGNRQAKRDRFIPTGLTRIDETGRRVPYFGGKQ